MTCGGKRKELQEKYDGEEGARGTIRGRERSKRNEISKRKRKDPMA